MGLVPSICFCFTKSSRLSTTHDWLIHQPITPKLGTLSDYLTLFLCSHQKMTLSCSVMSDCVNAGSVLSVSMCVSVRLHSMLDCKGSPV